jgi:hypothetical protein
MVIASQEQRGVNQGGRGAVNVRESVDSEVTFAAYPEPNVSHRSKGKAAAWDDMEDTEDPLSKRFQSQYNRLERRRDYEDPDYMPMSQEDRETRYSRTIESQEIDSVLSDVDPRTWRPQKVSGKVWSPPKLQQELQPIPMTQMSKGNGSKARGTRSSATGGRQTTLPRPEAPPSPVVERQERQEQQHQRSVPSAAESTNTAKTKKPRQYAVERTRNQRFDTIAISNQKKRLSNIEQTTKNWKTTADRLFPKELIPKGENPRTNIMEPLEPPDVSTTLLDAMRDLSKLTKGRCVASCGRTTCQQKRRGSQVDPQRRSDGHRDFSEQAWW